MQPPFGSGKFRSILYKISLKEKNSLHNYFCVCRRETSRSKTIYQLLLTVKLAWKIFNSSAALSVSVCLSLCESNHYMHPWFSVPCTNSFVFLDTKPMNLIDLSVSLCVLWEQHAQCGLDLRHVTVIELVGTYPAQVGRIRHRLLPPGLALQLRYTH